MILCWELSIISQKCFVQTVDMRVANVEISWTCQQITASTKATQPTRQHKGHSPWCRVSQFYKQVRCCPLPMSEKPEWYQNMEHLWIANFRSSNSSFQVTLSSHTILYLLRVLMVVSFFFTGLMTPRLVHILGQHTWNTKPVPPRASMIIEVDSRTREHRNFSQQTSGEATSPRESCARGLPRGSPAFPVAKSAAHAALETNHGPGVYQD